MVGRVAAVVGVGCVDSVGAMMGLRSRIWALYPIEDLLNLITGVKSQS
jgi:hypothetical protein